MSKLRHLLAALCLTSMTFVMVARAAEPPKVAPKTDDAKTKVEELSQEQDRLKRQYDELKASLLRLAQRLESSSKQEDKDKAKAIKEAIAKASELGVDSKFNALITGLKGNNVSKDLDQLQSAIDRNDDLQKDIRAIIELLLRDDKAKRDAEMAAQLREMLERLNEIIKKQERHQAKVELGREKSDDLAKGEKNIKDDTQRVLDPNAKKNAPSEAKKAEGKPNPNGKDGKPGESKPDAEKPKADGRPQEGKGSDNKDDKAESKPGDSKDAKPGEGKPGEGKDNKDAKPGEGKPGEGKDNKDAKPSDSKGGEAKNDMGKEAKPGESKSGESKPGEGKPGEGKPGEGKDNKDSKPGEGKPGEGKDNKDSKPSDGKGGESKPGMGKPSEGKPNDGKGGEPKPGEAKPSESKNSGNKPNDGAKPGEGKPGQGKPGDPKPGEGKPGQGKPGDPKPGEGKPGQGKPSEGKPSDSKGKGDGKGEAKPGEGKPGMGMGEGKPSESKGGESKPGMGGAGKPSEGKPSEGQGGEGKPGKPGKPSEQTPAEQAAARKQIEEAIKSQEKAIEKLKKDDKQGAEDDENKATEVLKSAKKKLEDLLRQLREEEVERILAQLQTRCEQMLAMQIKVRDDTLVLDKSIKSNADAKPTRTDEQSGLSLSDNENKIVAMSEKAIEIIEAEGSAVAFAEVFKQVRTDMKHIEVRLRKTDAGTVTVVIENDVIATLEDMIAALKKARQENKEQKPQPPKPGDPPPQGPKPPQDLINEIAELKMIRAMQVRVNDRTKVYGKQYNGDKVEQLPPPPPGADKKDVELYQRIEGELRDLGARQTKIEKVTRDIATGKNKTN